jgi:hypothetical protein
VTVREVIQGVTARLPVMNEVSRRQVQAIIDLITNIENVRGWPPLIVSLHMFDIEMHVADF